MSIQDKVAIVTGGTHGIGRAVVLGLAEKGAKVVFTYLKSDESAAIVLDEIKELGGEAEAVKAEARDPGEAKRVVEETVRKFGRVDILVNDAGEAMAKALKGRKGLAVVNIQQAGGTAEEVLSFLEDL
ncbi:MAG: SDR family NAD(P)-dependent oxidoreductase [Candidatus Omnitrophica bacterium]|nr:SDR family NAD(P)-dependent oxidoreductase [Candidatus Omnitrophota bacterium]